MNSDYLRSRLEYNPETGIFVWKARQEVDRYCKTWNSKYAGKEAGTIKQADKLGTLFYKIINLDGKLYRAHRLAFIYLNMPLPKEIDHINGNGLDNRIANLQALDHELNCLKAKVPSNNTSGIKGVSLRKDTGMWTARISEKGRYRTLGSFKTRHEAEFKIECERKRILG